MCIEIDPATGELEELISPVSFKKVELNREVKRLEKLGYVKDGRPHVQHWQLMRLKKDGE